MIIVKKHHNYLLFGFKQTNNNTIRNRHRHCPPLLILIGYCLIIIIISSNNNNNNNNNDDDYYQTTKRHIISAHASIVQIPRPEAMYGSSETGTSPMEDLEDEDDDGMDADASDAYGTADQDADDDENFGGDGYGFDSAESKLTWTTIVPLSAQQQANNYTNHSSTDRSSSSHLAAPIINLGGPNDDHHITTGTIRIKRDYNILNKAKKNGVKDKAAAAATNNNNDYGEDESWVHDGVDDIFVDPETKNAASELSYDEKSIDAEYAPYQQRQQQNRTRLTTITEVIPIINNNDDNDDDNDADSDDYNNGSAAADKENQDSSRIDIIEHIEPAANGQQQQRQQQQQQAMISGTHTPHGQQQQLTNSNWDASIGDQQVIGGAGGAGAGAAVNRAAVSLNQEVVQPTGGANFMMAAPINNVNWLNNGAANQYLATGYNNGGQQIGGQNAELSVLATMLAKANIVGQQQMAPIFENQASDAYTTNQYIIKTIPYNEIR